MQFRVLAIAAVLGCSGTSSRPAAIPPVKSTITAAPQLRAAPPAGLPFATLDAERRRFRSEGQLEGLAAEPAIGAAGPLISEDPGGRPAMSTSKFVDLIKKPHPKPTGKRFHVEERLLRREPSVSLGNGRVVTVLFETIRPIPGASLYLGTVPPGPGLGLARYRKQATEAVSSKDGKKHSISYKLGKLLKAKYAHDDLRLRGRGVLAMRLEVLDREEGSTRLFDLQTQLRCQPSPCTPESELVQLPSFSIAPVIDLPTPSSAVVSFDTDVATSARVLVVDAGGAMRRVDSEVSGTHHEIEVGELEPDRAYRYYVIIGDRRAEIASSRGAVVRTAPGGDRPVSFVVMSDSRSGHGVGEQRFAGTNMEVLRALFDRIDDEPTDFAIFAGDQIDGFQTSMPSFDYELRQWRRTVQPWAASLPIYEGMGNHEQVIEAHQPGWALPLRAERRAEESFAEHFVNPRNGPKPRRPDAPTFMENTYSFDYGTVHVASITSNYWFRSHDALKDHPAGDRGHREGWVPTEVLDWLDRDLADARKRGQRHLFVFTHEPAFPNGGHAKDGMYWHGKEPHVLAMRDR
ncbi:MAG: hypothetical protein KJO07_12925, partial [Deltaproteobacteria bacterium]|nr:hypothetical protein [Deltaproteobacteria bacterium]